MKRPHFFKNIGPGALVSAAFIGPGTVTICSKAGASFGFSLLWALLISVLATIILQEMAARFGLITGKGLAEGIRTTVQNKIGRTAIVILTIAAIIIGNSAYQAGNISGGILGLSTFVPNWEIVFENHAYNLWPLSIGLLAFIILYFGNYRILERILIIFVLLMSLSFIAAALLTSPNWSAIVGGTFIPQIPEGSLMMIIGLIGTTVVPYNLFLHASVVQEKWTHKSELSAMRKDTIISIGLGGFVSMSIIIAAAAIQSKDISNVNDIAKGLVPVYGSAAEYFIGIGLFAAGISSALTAPMAAAYVAQGCFGWKKDLKNKRSRMVWGLVLCSGVFFAIIGKSPIEMIQFAQIANGLLLPIVAILLLVIMNNKNLMGSASNSIGQNLLGILIILFVTGLAVKMFYSLLFL